MSKAIYSFGEESPLKFEVSDKLARRYNDAVAKFFKAQQRFNQKFGRTWNPATEPIEIRWTKGERKAWNEFSKIFNRRIREQGPFHINDIMDDFLIKNTIAVASGALIASNKVDRAITLAAYLGSLYGLFSGHIKKG